jgi:drug/metabolite transporter (DMT)-like permease
LVYIGLALAGGSSGIWPLAAGQLASVALLGIGVGVLRPTWVRSQHLGSLLIAAGGFGITAIMLFALATTVGVLAVAAALTSLYPAITVALAALFADESPSRGQLAGMGIGATAVMTLVAT